jgi:hypothetical protein
LGTISADAHANTAAHVVRVTTARAARAAREDKETAIITFGVGAVVAAGKVLGRTVEAIELVDIHALKRIMVS